MAQQLSQDQVKAFIEQALIAGHSPEAIEKHLKANKDVPETFKIATPTIRNPTTKLETKPLQPTEIRQPGDFWARTGLSLAGGGTGALIGGGIGSLAGGVGAVPGALAGFDIGSGVTDALVDRFMGTPNYAISGNILGIIPKGKELTENPNINTAVQAAENIVTGKAIGGALSFGAGAVGRMFREADRSALKTAFKGTPKLPYVLNKMEGAAATIRDKMLSKFYKGPTGKGSVSGEFSKYDPTLIQYLDKPHHLIESIENLFARKQKEVAIENSGKIALKKAEEKLSSLVGRKVSLKDSDLIAQRIQNQVSANFDNINTALEDVTQALDVLDPAWKQIPYKKLSKQAQVLKDNYDELVDTASLFFPTGKKKIYQLSKQEALNPVRYTYYPTPILNNVMDDAVELNKLLTSGEIKIGSKGKVFKGISSASDAKGYQFMRMINESYDSAKQLMDTDLLINKWNKYKETEMGKRLYNQADRANFDQFFKDLGKLSVPLQGTGPSRYLTLRLGTGAVSLGAGLATGLTSGAKTGLVTGAAITGGAIALNQLGKLMTNPNTARLMIAAAKGGPLGMSPAMAGRVIGRALRGQPMTVYIKDEQGNETPFEGFIDSTGKFKINQ